MAREITFDRFIRAITGIVIVALVYVLLLRLSNVLVPFFVAWLAAYMLYPIVCFFQYRCKLKNRVVSIVVTLLLIIGILTSGIALILPPVINEVARLKDVIIDFVESNRTMYQVSADVTKFISRNIDLQSIAKEMTFSDISSIIEERVPQIFSFLTSSINALVGIIASLISIIYMFFILIDYEQMGRGFIQMVPKSKREIVKGVIEDVEIGMNRYFRGQGLIAMLVGILFAIGFTIIGFPLAIPLGLFIGFLNLVPYLQTLGFIPTIILAMLHAHDTGGSFCTILLSALIVFAVVQAIQDWYLVPRIMGKVTGLNAAVILLSLSVWGSLLGFIGLIIALPLTTLLLSYYKRYVLERQE